MEFEDRKSSPRLRGASEPKEPLSPLRLSSDRRLSPKPENKSINWSDDIEKVVKAIGDSSLGYKWMCILSAKQTGLRYDALMYLMIFIGPLSGVFSSISLTYPTDNDWLSIIALTLSFLSGVISTSLKFSQLDEKSTSFKQMAAKYASLEGNVRRQLSLGRNERISAGDYLEWITTSFDELFASTPLIPDGVYKEWVQFAGKNNLSIPKELGRVITVGEDDKLNQLGSIQNIAINTTGSRETVVEVKERPPHEEPRPDTYNGIPDLNKFADGKMRYELRRLFGIK